MLKFVMTNVYAHQSNLEELLTKVAEEYKAEVRTICEKHLADHEVDVILKWDKKDHTISMIESPDWNESNEPIVGDATIFYLDTGDVKVRKGRKKNYQIYHNKWQFVSDSYDGFSIEDAKARTELWNSIPDICSVKNKIGNQDFWFALLDANGIVH